MLNPWRARSSCQTPKLIASKARHATAQAAGLGPRAVLLALAATCYHAVAFGGLRQPMVPPDLIVDRGEGPYFKSHAFDPS
jgi:hypothetical protein